MEKNLVSFIFVEEIMQSVAIDDYFMKIGLGPWKLWLSKVTPDIQLSTYLVIEEPA